MVERKSDFILQIFFGVLLLGFSGCAVLAQFGREYLPSMFFSSSFIEFLLILLGVIFVIDAVKHRHLPEKTIRLFVGMVVLLFGALPLFHVLGMLKFLPVIIFLNVSPLVLSLLLFVSALYFVVDRILLVLWNEKV